MNEPVDPLPHFRWLVTAAAKSWQLLRDSEPPIQGHILEGSLEAHRILMLSRWREERARAALRTEHSERIVHDLGRMAHEAAHFYKLICQLEGDHPLADPFNQGVLERQLRSYANTWQDIWQRRAQR